MLPWGAAGLSKTLTTTAQPPSKPASTARYAVPLSHPPTSPPKRSFCPCLTLPTPTRRTGWGGFFAVLERIQEASAGGPGKLNSTIRDRYYGAASSTPVAVFTTLLRLKNAHLKKLTVGQAAWFEKLVGEILDSVTDFPKHLPLPNHQGHFCAGLLPAAPRLLCQKT